MRTDGRTVGPTDGMSYRRTEERSDGRTGERMDGRTNERTDRRMDGHDGPIVRKKHNLWYRNNKETEGEGSRERTPRNTSE